MLQQASALSIRLAGITPGDARIRPRSIRHPRLRQIYHIVAISYYSGIGQDFRSQWLPHASTSFPRQDPYPIRPGEPVDILQDQRLREDMLRVCSEQGVEHIGAHLNDSSTSAMPSISHPTAVVRSLGRQLIYLHWRTWNSYHQIKLSFIFTSP
ncbi:hypothetical protein BS78_10G161500 [Paspalum vaginatum]|nr:hypothetical protein BS78_10G161500 [Paspalum vaginatum]